MWINSSWSSETPNKSNEDQERFLADWNYGFLGKPKYDRLREFLGGITHDDIIHEWLNAVIFKHLNPALVIKVAKPSWDALETEFRNHVIFWKTLLSLQETDLINNRSLRPLHIPYIERFDDEHGIYVMDRVFGHSFRSIATLDHHRQTLWDMPHDFYHQMTDREIERFLQSRGLATVSQTMTEDEWMWDIFNPQRSEQVEIIKKCSTMIHERMDSLLDLFRSRWCIYNDPNPGNFMLTPDGQTWLIDFWNCTIKP
jgi:serine/threonine protein kinase